MGNELSSKTSSDDKKMFLELEEAMHVAGFTEVNRLDIFRVLSGVLHLGNTVFDDEDAKEGAVAIIKDVGYSAVTCASDCLGIEEAQLRKLLLERYVKTREGVIVVRRNRNEATSIRDAIAKTLYCNLFQYLINNLNEYLGGDAMPSMPFIGVLDIFGFETFQVNSFEQLLINFANESLQNTFNEKIFDAELKLFKQEGMITQETMQRPPDNHETIALLAGKLRSRKEDNQSLLVQIDIESREPQASDSKMLRKLHATFGKHPSFPRVHPRDANHMFQIAHFAGCVKYTVDGFIEKNNDQLPSEAATVFSTSSVQAVNGFFHADDTGSKKKVLRSVVKNFRSQIVQLVETLENTECSFIRCVKPNPHMTRDSANNWFSRHYVADQLCHLSIPQTAMVLQSKYTMYVLYMLLTNIFQVVCLPESLTAPSVIHIFRFCLPKRSTATPNCSSKLCFGRSKSIRRNSN